MLQGTADPFVEFSQYGFRGYDTTFWGGSSPAQTAVCGRTCSWYASLTPDIKSSLIAANRNFLTRLALGLIDPSDPFNYGGDAKQALYLSAAEAAQFDAYCTAPNAALYGFPDRKMHLTEQPAPQGGYYWWNGAVQYWPNLSYQRSVLQLAQTAYFTGVVVARLADLLICKTRKESLFKQGLRNKVLNLGLLSMIVIVCLINYVPFIRTVWNTRPLYPLYLFVGMPYFVAILLYDETRKALIRRRPKGWVYRNTSY
jgi:sodium/potassium-transporting ATPase subunit alpha